MKFLSILFVIILRTIQTNQTKYESYKSSANLVPFPQQIVSYPKVWSINSNNFKMITKTKQNCEILNESIKRYNKLFFINRCLDLKTISETMELFANTRLENSLTNMTIEVRGNCDEWPQLNMDEMYTIRVDTEDFPEQAVIFSNTIWGALRALETFSQLIQHKFNTIFTINSTFILDFPRFTYRGLLMDTSRHYLPIHVILDNLDAMAYHKMNVLHWHIVDDQSFPLISNTFPELSSKGSFDSRTHVYSTEDIENVVQFARFRGIRVIVELDTPGHTLSWGKGYPQLLTECYSGDKPNGQFGPLNPSRNTTFDFLESLFEEIVQKFNDNYIHLGGNDVNYLCWKSNPEINAFMKSKTIDGKYNKLEEYYFEHLLNIVSGLNRSAIVWEDLFDRDINIPNNTVVNVWKKDFNKKLYNLTKLGFQVILSSVWPLDQISYGYDWFEYYSSDPQAFNGTEQQNQLVLGGQASVWGHYIDGSNFMTTTWPRTMAVAERLWSPKSLINYTEAQYRFVPNRCRMLERGLQFQPVVEPKRYDFGFCKCDYKV